MQRRGFLRVSLGALFFAGARAGGDPWARRIDAHIRTLRGRGLWAARLDDPAYGGRGDGTTLNDAPLLQALADMPDEGGTLVIPPAGTWLFDAVDLAQAARRGVVLDATGALLVKAARTRAAMFRDTAGRSRGLSVVGGTFDLSASSFRAGDTVSAFFLVRPDDASFSDVTVRNGIEEGLKLYKPRGLSVKRGRFERLINNGVQIHAPERDGYTGEREDRDTSDVVVENAKFVAVDDGLGGMEGQGVSVSSASRERTARDVRVSGCTFDRCVRGAWAEFNQAGQPGVDIAFEKNLVTASVCHGLGMVGVRDGVIRGNRVLDTGSIVPGTPGTAASEVAGIVLSGSERNRGEDMVVEDNEIVERRAASAARMQYGIVVRRQEEITVQRNAVRGATVRSIDVDRGTVRGTIAER